MTYSAEQRARWARQLEAIDLVVQRNSGAQTTYCDALLDFIPFNPPSGDFRRASEAIREYDFHLAVDILENLAERAYRHVDREVAAAAARQVRLTYEHFSDLMCSGAALNSALYHGMLDAYLTLKD